VFPTAAALVIPPGSSCWVSLPPNGPDQTTLVTCLTCHAHRLIKLADLCASVAIDSGTYLRTEEVKSELPVIASFRFRFSVFSFQYSVVIFSFGAERRRSWNVRRPDPPIYPLQPWPWYDRVSLHKPSLLQMSGDLTHGGTDVRRQMSASRSAREQINSFSTPILTVHKIHLS